MAAVTSRGLEEPHPSLQSSFTQTEAWTASGEPLDGPTHPPILNSESAGQLLIAHHALRQQYGEAQQMIERQNRELKQKDSIIALLTDQLDRVSGMAAAVADEVQATRRTLAFAASTAPHSAGSPLYRGSRQCSQSASPAATKGRPGRLAAGVSYKVEGSPRGVIISPEVTCQQQHQQEECFRGLQVKVASGLDVSGMQNWLHAQNGTLTQQVAGGRNSQAAAAVAAAAEALSAAEAAADDVREAPVTGAKRLRICSTESAEDVAAGGVVLKRAVSGGSSSSRQLVSTDHQAVPEEEEEEVGCGAATEVVTWQHQASPDSIMQEQQQQQLQHFENGVDPMMEDEEQYDMGGEEQSPDEREAASHLLAFSAAAKASSPQGPCSPTVFGSSRCGAGLREGHHPAPSGPVAEQHWHLPGGSHSHGGTQPGLPMAPALHTILLQQAPALVEAMAAKQTGMQAMAGSVPGAHLQQEASGRILLHHGQQGLPGRAAAPGNLHSYREHYHHLQLYHQQQQLTGSDGMAERRRKSETQDATWGPSRSTAAPANKARKGSWFKQEISGKIPASVQQACIQHWSLHQCVPVVCNEQYGTFVINRAGEYLIRLDSGDFVSPNKFEELAGKKTARNWQQSIRVVGHTMSGEANSALLKLGHFTRIVGLVQQK